MRSFSACLAGFVAAALWAAAVEAQPAGEPPAGKCEALGVPVRSGRLTAERVGPDAQGRLRVVYLAFSQATGRPPFLMVVDPDVEEVSQFLSPPGCNAGEFKTLYPSSDGYMYVGARPARLLRFDPRMPEKGLMDLGELPGAEAIWSIQEGGDRQIYMATSGRTAGLYSWDPRSGRVRNRGSLSDRNEVAAQLLVSLDGWTLYAAVGHQERDVVAYDLKIGERHSLMKDENRGPGIFRLSRGKDGLLYAELPGQRPLPVHSQPIRRELPWNMLEDGRHVFSSAERVVIVKIDGQRHTIPLTYEAGAEITTCHLGPDGAIYVFTRDPLQMCRYDPKSGEMLQLGNPFGTALGSAQALTNWEGKIVMAAFSGCELAIYDPAKPWNKGSRREDNPWIWGFPKGQRLLRPIQMLRGSDRLIYIAVDGGYGQPDALVCMDPASGDTIFNLAEPVKGMAVRCMAADPQRRILYLGCELRDAKGEERNNGPCVAAWDAEQQKVIWQSVPAEEATHVASLTYVSGRLCGTTYHRGAPGIQYFFVMNPERGEILHIKKTFAAGVVNNNVQLGPDGWLYGISHEKPILFRVHPVTYTFQKVAQAQEARGMALAVTHEGVYYDAGAVLMRFRFDRPLLPEK